MVLEHLPTRIDGECICAVTLCKHGYVWQVDFVAPRDDDDVTGAHGHADTEEQAWEACEQHARLLEELR